MVSAGGRRRRPARAVSARADVLRRNRRCPRLRDGVHVVRCRRRTDAARRQPEGAARASKHRGGAHGARGAGGGGTPGAVVETRGSAVTWRTLLEEAGCATE